RRIQDRLSGRQPPALRSQGGNRAGRAVANVKQTEAMSGSAQKVRLEETLALTPALSPRRGGSTHSSRKFSRILMWRCFIEITPKMLLNETLALTPALSPRRGGIAYSPREFSRPLVWHWFMGIRTDVMRRVCNEDVVGEL